MASSLDAEQLRLIARVARLYYSRDMRQTLIASELGISQARVSRLLASADQLGIVKTIVMSPPGIYPDLESAVEDRYRMLQVHVVEAPLDESEPREALGKATASVLESMPLEDKSIGFTAWSRALRAMARAMAKNGKSAAANIVELLGDVGSPLLQHDATLATERFANAVGARPVFLRLPSVVSSQVLRQSLVKNDPHSAIAMNLMDHLDVALVGLGSCNIASPQYTGASFFTEQQLELPIAAGAVGQINLRFIDAEGNPVVTELDSLVIGITLEQLAKVPVRIAVAAGRDKQAAIRAAMRGGWINVLITDRATAQLLLTNENAILATT